jgi:hypothetical protein
MGQAFCLAGIPTNWNLAKTAFRSSWEGLLWSATRTKREIRQIEGVKLAKMPFRSKWESQLRFATRTKREIRQIESISGKFEFGG